MWYIQMCFRDTDYNQVSMNVKLSFLTERQQRFLDKSWAKLFSERVFPLINAARFEVLYCKDNGRPNAPVRQIIGALLLKELTQVTDEELLECVILDPRYQYALHLTGFDEIPFSDRTVSRFRERLYHHEVETGEDLLKAEIEGLSAEFAKMLKIHGTLKRMDSVMISSSCKNMGRLELIYTCVANLVKALVKSGESGILPDYLLKYAESSNKNSVCYRLKDGEVRTRLEEVTAHALELYKLAEYARGGEDEFQLLERMLKDQTENGTLKQNKDISPDSLQNPSDEDATFRRKAGKGYHGFTGNIVEDCGEEGNIITHYDYDVNIHSDVAFGAEVIEELGPQEETTVLITDGAYPSEENFEAAKDSNIEFVPTALTGQEPPEILNEFEIEDQTILTCPGGHAPDDCTYNEEKGQYRAYFNKGTCEGCPRRDECPAILQKKSAVVTLSQTGVQRAAYLKMLASENYREYARKRNGVEGIPSILRRRYGVDHMPVRGLVRSKMWFGFKIGAINIKRVIKAALSSLQIGTFSELSDMILFEMDFFEFSFGFPCAA